MQALQRYISTLLLLILSTLASLHAQTVREDADDERDTVTVDSLWTDTLQQAASEQIDTLPWPHNVRAELEKLLSSDMFSTSQVGMMIWDLDADSAIFARGERQLLRPASTMKAITAIVALDKLGGGYQFKTELCYTGRVDSCTLVGDVYCVGGFDPRFNNDDLRAFAEALRRMGIDTIRGNLYADKSMKDADRLGEGWCWDDDNPVLSPLLIGRKDDFMTRFYDALVADGIYLQGALGEKTKPQSANCIVTRFHTIDQILMRMLKESDNLYAESMFYQIGAATGDRPATAKSASRVIKQLVSKVGLRPSAYAFADGSGLSLYNYVSAELEVRLLRYAYQNENIYHHLLPALPSAGEDGTLRKRMRQTFTLGNVKAKTGTVTGVSSLCGYLTAYNGHRLCFAIINQGLRHVSNGRNFQDRVCSILSRPH